ncbi:DUF262 domain-containing protein [Rhizobium sp. CC-YZS058]|uniref:DUF262 domain-containing protein n=1 Tax=Rhizobium sp. CC-YZS058 TaxID=3042153 RepID=UPI002B055736|nr:DUF262 domain-containing protein [Rhizobium sp. CC-YZS058]MEA3535629.1 DUF262 domain-containing protein [Rhizobium sp. CC-YZS058]
MVDESKLESEITTDAVDFSFGELLNLHREKEIIIRPEYQRLFRWSNEQRSRLIESVLLRLPIPPIFLVENEDSVLELIDGLQRTSSVLQFLDHDAIGQPELVLEGCDILKALNGVRFDDLSTSLKLKIKRTPIRAIIIKKSGDQFVKYEMFKRLNTGGSLLSAQEIRNCSCRMIKGGENFYSALQKWANVPEFEGAIARLPEAGRDMRADEELVLRFFAVKDFREGFKGNIEEWLNNYMEDILLRHKPFDVFEEDGVFRQVFGLIFSTFGDGAFSRYNSHGEPTGRLAPAYFEAVVGAITDSYAEVSQVDPHLLRSRLKAAFSSDEFISSTGPGANSNQKFNRRIAVVKQHLLALPNGSH